MRKQGRAILWSLLTFALLIFASACGNGGNGGGGNSSGPVTLTMWGMGTEGDNLKVLAQDFHQKNPNITVQVQAIPWSDAHNKLLTSVAGNQTPDIAQMGTTWMAEFAKTGALASPPGSISQGSFFKSAWDTATVDGTVYGVPWYVDTRVLFYRSDIAQKAGIIQPPQTWDELMAAAKAMKEKGGSKYGIFLANNDWEELLPFVWQNGGQVVNGSNFTLESPQVTEALTYYQSFFKQGLTPQSVPVNFDVPQSFVRGDTPMFFSGPWSVGLIEQAGGTGIQNKWAVAPMPRKTTTTSFVGGSDLVVFKNSQHSDAAWKFVQYLSQPDVQTKWYDTVKDLPAVQSAWNSGALASDKSLSVFHTQLSDTQGPPTIPKWEEVATAIQTDMEQVMLGKMTPQQGANDMQQKANSIGTGQ